MIMNPGYLTIVIILTIGILLLSGWKDLLLKEMTYPMIIVFITGWLVCSFFSLHFKVWNVGIRLNVAFIFIILISGIFIIHLRSALERLHLFIQVLLLCMSDFALREASKLSIVSIAMLLALLTVVIQRNPLKQTIALLVGFLGSNLLSVFVHQRTQLFVLGEQPYQDLWWFTLLLTRIMAFMYEYGVLSFRKMYLGFFAKK
jgi:hypothetical protein